MMPSVAIFIPVYNEEKILARNLESLISDLDGFMSSYQIIVISNGSTDSTPQIGRGLAAAYPQVIFDHINERGVGHAFRKGLSLTAAEKIITVDADLTTERGFINQASALLDKYDIVIGSKNMGGQERSSIRITGSNLFIRSAEFLLGLPYGDYSIGAKAYRRTTIARYLGLIGGGSSYVIDIIYKAWGNNANIIEVPVRCRDKRKSHFNLAHEGVYRFYRLFRLWSGIVH